VTWRKVDNQVVILDLHDSCYLRTNAVGSLLWERLQVESTMDELASLLIDTFGIDAATAMRDASQFVESLRANNLLSDPSPDVSQH
jgi:hypothetical protein